MFDEEDFRDYEDEIQNVVKQYEEMLERTNPSISTRRNLA